MNVLPRGACPMRKPILILAALLAATPALADKKLAEVVLKAESLAEKGKPEVAVKAVQKVAEQSNAPDAYLALARLQSRLASPEDAQVSVTKAVELSASAAPEMRAEALAALSGLDLMRGTGRDALTHAEEAVTAAPRRATAPAPPPPAPAPWQDGGTDQKPGEACAGCGKAILARDPKRWDEAIAQAQQGAFLNPRDPLVQLAVGQIFEAGNNLDQAALAYGRALAGDPGFTPARVANVQVLVRKGQTDAALADAQKIVQEMPGNAQAQLQLGRLYMRKGDWPNAATSLEQAARLAPADAETQARLGTALQYGGKKAEARAAYKRAVELDPKNIDYRTTYGLILGVNGQAAAGAEELKKVISTPGYHESDGYVNRGWLYRNTEPKRIDDSIAAYKRALELNPKEEQAALGMGWSYINQKNWDAAIASFNQAMQIDPTTTPEASNAIGWSYLFKKNPAKAREYYDKGSAAGRADARLKTNIERLEKGIELAQQALEAPPPPPRIERPDPGTPTATLASSRDANARRKAAHDLATYGGDGSP